MKTQKLMFGEDVLEDSSHRTPINWASIAKSAHQLSAEASTSLLASGQTELRAMQRAPGGSGKINRINGDDRNNRLVGTKQDDVIKGQGGNDALFGLAGSDRLLGGDGNDRLFGGPGDDLLNGGKGRDLLDGGAGNDLLYDTSGEDVADKLRGGTGDDSLLGGGGSDILDAGAGNDSLLSYNDGKIDTLLGGAGNDGYFVGANDLTIELPNGGFDTVSTGLDVTSWTLADNIENLLLGGNAPATGIGNQSDNILQGGFDEAATSRLEGLGGNDILSGGAANDTLVGGDGADRFSFDSFATSSIASRKTFGVDTITDFVSSTDKIALAQGTFSALTTAIGQNLGGEFAAAATDVLAETSTALLVFSEASKTLFYNSNGSAAGFGTLDFSGAFAILTGVTTLSSGDIQIVSRGLANPLTVR